MCSNTELFLHESKCVVITVLHTKNITTNMSQSCLWLSSQSVHLTWIKNILDVETGEATYGLQTGPTFPNYSLPSPDTTHQLLPTLTKYMSQTSQLYMISTRQDQNI